MSTPISSSISQSTVTLHRVQPFQVRKLRKPASTPAKRSGSKVFYALGFVILAILLLSKLSEQKAPSGDVPRPTGEVYGIVGVVTADMPQAWEIAQLYRAKKSVIPWGAPPGYYDKSGKFIGSAYTAERKPLKASKGTIGMVGTADWMSRHPMVRRILSWKASSPPPRF